MNPIFSNPFLRLNQLWEYEGKSVCITSLTFDQVYYEFEGESYSCSQNDFLEKFRPLKVKESPQNVGFPEFTSAARRTIDKFLKRGFDRYEIAWALQNEIVTHILMNIISDDLVVEGSLWDSKSGSFIWLVLEVEADRIKIITSDENPDKGSYWVDKKEFLEKFVERK